MTSPSFSAFATAARAATGRLQHGARAALIGRDTAARLLDVEHCMLQPAICSRLSAGSRSGAVYAVARACPHRQYSANEDKPFTVSLYSLAAHESG
jgi:hypothetical protein